MNNIVLYFTLGVIIIRTIASSLAQPTDFDCKFIYRRLQSEFFPKSIRKGEFQRSVRLNINVLKAKAPQKGIKFNVG